MVRSDTMNKQWRSCIQRNPKCDGEYYVYGKKKDPRISTLIRIADYFNISLDELIGRKSED